MYKYFLFYCEMIKPGMYWTLTLINFCFHVFSQVPLKAEKIIGKYGKFHKDNELTEYKRIDKKFHIRYETLNTVMLLVFTKFISNTFFISQLQINVFIHDLVA